jgi:hypothetical protein
MPKSILAKAKPATMKTRAFILLGFYGAKFQHSMQLLALSPTVNHAPNLCHWSSHLHRALAPTNFAALNGYLLGLLGSAGSGGSRGGDIPSSNRLLGGSRRRRRRRRSTLIPSILLGGS